jgi:4-diphosphocytidyl-2C-methyl-D-erythritol kinase
MGNDFHAVVSDQVPAVAEVAQAMEAAGLEDVLLSGSGSAVFGFPPATAAENVTTSIVATLRAALPDASVFAVTTLSAMPAPYPATARG